MFSVASALRDVKLRIEDLHFAVGFDVAGSDLAFAAGLDIHPLGARAMELGCDPFDVEHDLRHILLDAGDGGEFVLDAGNFNGGHGGARQGAEEDAAQGVAQGGAVSVLQWLNNILSVGNIAVFFVRFDAGFFDFNHYLFCPPSSVAPARRRLG